MYRAAMRLSAHIRLILLLASAILATSPTGPGKFIMSRASANGQLDLAYIDTAFHFKSPLQYAGDSISLKKSFSSPGTFGDATHVAQITVDSFGIVHNVTNVTIS